MTNPIRRIQPLVSKWIEFNLPNLSQNNFGAHEKDFGVTFDVQSNNHVMVFCGKVTEPIYFLSFFSEEENEIH